MCVLNLPGEEVPAAMKNSDCPADSFVASRSWSSFSSDWKTGFLQRNLAGFGRKLHWRFALEDFQCKGHLEDLWHLEDLCELSLAEMSAAGCFCA